MLRFIQSPLRWICLGAALLPFTSPAQAPYPAPQVAQYVDEDRFRRQYAGALPSLLEELNRITTWQVDPSPVFIHRFDDPEIFKYPVVYLNYADRANWEFDSAEKAALKRYLERGGFLFVDAGINAAFLRGDPRHGQTHNFPDWQVSPEVEQLFAEIFPNQIFGPLSRDHALFSSYYRGLPETENLPEAVREFVVNEKWPQGTVAMMGLELDGRLAVLATPILAMGWERNEVGQWTNQIAFRIRESAEGLSERLQDAAYNGEQFEIKREDGRTDVVYCQPAPMPAWVQEADGDWRVFRYYQNREISDYAHIFFTRIGVNIFTYVIAGF